MIKESDQLSVVSDQPVGASFRARPTPARPPIDAQGKLRKPNRRPVHLEYIGGKSPRQRVWEMIRAWQGAFTLPDLAGRLPSGIHYDTTRTYLKALVAAGFVERRCEGRASPLNQPTYALVQDHGVEAPRLKNNGRPVTQGRAQENLWRTLRALGRDFTIHELTALSWTEQTPVSLIAAADYIKHLRSAGYLRHDKGRYRLMLNTGPRPPMVQRVHRVYDPNLHQVMWIETGADDE